MDVLWSLLLLLTAFFTPHESTPTDQSAVEPASIETAVVTNVIDGDTIDVLLNGEAKRVRYIGIDTPEPHRDGEPACYAHEATEANRELVDGKTVSLVADAEDTDRFGRLLRYVYVDDEFVNASLVADGFARTMTIKPNTAEATVLHEKEDNAQADQLGMWGACN